MHPFYDVLLLLCLCLFVVVVVVVIVIVSMSMSFCCCGVVIVTGCGTSTIPLWLTPSIDPSGNPPSLPSPSLWTLSLDPLLSLSLDSYHDYPMTIFPSYILITSTHTHPYYPSHSLIHSHSLTHTINSEPRPDSGKTFEHVLISEPIFSTGSVHQVSS